MTLDVNVVYGDSHRLHIIDVLIPSLRENLDVRFNLFHYDGINGSAIPSFVTAQGTEVRSVPNRTGRVCGFAESNNILFRECVRGPYFILLNPDCILVEGSIRILRDRIEHSKATIVEGRQWPLAHPKEYDPLTLETPWATGAFCIIDSAFYEKQKGMDEAFFLYAEDVDLSWRAWLTGGKVLYDPRASVAHFSGQLFYSRHIICPEEYYSLRNFIAISYKFFGEEGEQKAIDMVGAVPRQVAKSAIAEYVDMKPKIERFNASSHPMVKITGVSLFHAFN